MERTDFERFRKLAEKGTIVPVFREMPADMKTPVSVLERFVDDANVCLMESVEISEKFGRYSFLGVNPRGTFTVENGTPYLCMDGQRLKLKYNTYPLDALRALVTGKSRVIPHCRHCQAVPSAISATRRSQCSKNSPPPKRNCRRHCVHSC